MVLVSSGHTQSKRWLTSAPTGVEDKPLGTALTFFLPLCMAELTRKQERLLNSLGRPVIELPAEIHFNGDERLQKSHCEEGTCSPGQCICGKGMHHLPKYQYTGTFDHPNNKAYRERVINDRRERLMRNRMSVTEMKKIQNMEELKIPEKSRGFIEEQMEHKRQLADASAAQNDQTRGRPRVNPEPVNPMEEDTLAKVATSKEADKAGPAFRSEVKAK